MFRDNISCYSSRFDGRKTDVTALERGFTEHDGAAMINRNFMGFLDFCEALVTSRCLEAFRFLLVLQCQICF